VRKNQAIDMLKVQPIGYSRLNSGLM